MASARSGGSGQGGGGRPPGTGGQPPPPPHVIRPAEVAAWLADSVNKRVTHHRTTHADAQDILERGVEIARSRIGAYGQGFYTVTDPSAFPGDTTLALAVRTRRPLVGDEDVVGRRVDAIVEQVPGARGRITTRVAARIRVELLRSGYDAIIVRDGGGDGIDYVIVLDAAIVRVVRP